MKKLTLTICAVAALVTAANAGTSTYSGKEMRTETPCPTWYADNEWNIGISGVYAPTVNDWREDTYLGVDHGWGAALDVKYFVHRYWGFGVQGFGLAINQENDGFFANDDNNDFAGGVLGTFTFRYPIPCSRFAPYAWLGFGGIWGAGENNNFFNNDDSSDGHFMGQYGAGFEVRFTPRFGWTNDISYNHLEGSHNDFLQVRSGLNFAF